MSNIQPACRAIAAVLCLLAGISPALASVVLNGTRVVYQEPQREVALRATNDGTTPSLVQAWIDAGNPDAPPDDANVPFLLTPPLFRIDPGNGQTMRIILAGEPPPGERETLYWLNVLEVPPTAAPGEGPPNTLQFAFRTRIKLFYRPAPLDADGASQAAGKVAWRFVRKDGGYALEGSNPTPYHITFVRVKPRVGSRTYANGDGGMVAPGGTLELDIGKPASVPAATPDRVDFSFVNDYGGATDGFVDTRATTGH
ncbi:fimbrial biogenesis chaperone [Cupriavidus agavae]|uniref:Chaperone protein EcpD n=1 Tax=Cupriavidus agavae TaxID=1001822 RepID=A0A4Q7S460_9BURK|nr:molecular chaperone [Cupriavidus agavae]RZT41254.1 chaperone protein EcpD [Cupriavidus agavae]